MDGAPTVKGMSRGWVTAVLAAPILLLVFVGYLAFAKRLNGQYPNLSNAEVEHQKGTAAFQKVPEKDWLRLQDIGARLSNSGGGAPLTADEWSFIDQCLGRTDALRSNAIATIAMVNGHNPSREAAIEHMRAIANEQTGIRARQEAKGMALIFLKRAGDPNWRSEVDKVKSDPLTSPDLAKLCDIVTNSVQFNSGR